MNLFTCVSEEGDDGESTRSETTSLMSYTLRYVSFSEVVSVCWVAALREPMYLCTWVSEWHIKYTIVNRSCRIHRICDHEWGSEDRGSKKNDKEKYKCQFRDSISNPVTLFTLYLECPTEDIRLTCSTHEKMEDGPSPEHGTEPSDDMGRPSRYTHRDWGSTTVRNRTRNTGC